MAGRASSEIEGFLIIDKPAGITSHDVVSRLRRVLGERRIGHGGTLDPDATGVLVVAVGPATRLLRFVSGLDKTYVGEIVLGAETSTLDASGTVTKTIDMASITLGDVRTAAAALVGETEQIPPMVSAIQVGGRRLYELAREGIEVERQPRHVTISRVEIEPTETDGVFRVTLDCSSGTYVRVVAADIGVALGGVAHLRNLERTRIGGFRRDEAVLLDDVARADLRPSLGLVAHLSSTELPDDLVAAVGHGRVMTKHELGISGSGPWTIGSHGTLLAVYEERGPDEAKPILVMPAALFPRSCSGDAE